MAAPIKGRADYYEPGGWNATCSMCGRKRKASQMVQNWQGFWRCPDHNEPRQPQDFVRAPADVITVPWSQPPTDLDLTVCSFNSQSAVAGWAVADCMIAGNPIIDPSSI